jgi:serine/threonine-protein kinase
MGIVYKATDTKLNRDVAIKVLPPAALASEDDRARFYREAQAAAQLHHAHIATIFEIDEAVPSDAPHGTTASPFIVMECIQGETLEERINKGPMKLEDVVRIASEIAEALEMAHSKDIVHRDIKSANVMLTGRGAAKVLDFGLAKTAQSTMLTKMGSTLGTIAYMSPEQARGEEVDWRTDLWALGAVLYEMVAGRVAFGGDYEQAVVYNILNEAPDPLTSVRTGVPMGLEWIANKCLAKKASDRYQSAADLIVDLRNVDTTATSRMSSPGMSLGLSGQLSGLSQPISGVSHAPTAVEQPAKKTLSWPFIVGALLLGAALAYAGIALLQPTTPAPQLTRVELVFHDMGWISFPSMSPTGEYLAVVGQSRDGARGIYLRTMATGKLRYLEGSSVVGSREVHFSPSGDRIAFTTGYNGGVHVAVIPSGIPERLTDFGRPAYWEDEETIIMSDDKAGGGDMYRLRLDGSEPEKIELVSQELLESYGNVMYSGISGEKWGFGHQVERMESGLMTNKPPRIFSVNTESGEIVVLESNAINPEYVPGGFLTYQLQGDDGLLLVRPIDPSTGQFDGQPKNVLEDPDRTGWGAYSTTPAGGLLYSAAGDLIGGVSGLNLFLVNLETRNLQRVPLVLPNGSSIANPSFSHDGSKIVFDTGIDSDNGQIYVYDLIDGIQYQYTFDGKHTNGRFGADDEYLYFTSANEDSLQGIVRIPVDNSGPAEIVLEDAYLDAISRDGRYITATMDGDDGAPYLIKYDLLSETVVDTNGKDVPGTLGRFSPDGRYLAFQKDFDPFGEITIMSFAGNTRFPIPDVSAGRPVWSPDEQYLYYGKPNRIGRIPIRTQPVFNIRGDEERVMYAYAQMGYDLSPDGNLIVVAAQGVSFDTESADSDPVLIWLQNWSAHLKQEFGR